MKSLRLGIGLALKKALTVYVVVCFVFLSLIPSESSAVLIPTILPDVQSTASSQRESDLEKIQVLLESKLIAQRLSDLGLNGDEVKTRMAQLTDVQVHQIAEQLDSLQSGGNALGIIIALLVVVILVFILLQITGHKIIVTK
jgi:hypothetical protein